MFKYTPRTIDAYLRLGNKRRKRELSEDLSIGAMASRGEPKKLKDLQKQLEK